MTKPTRLQTDIQTARGLYQAQMEGSDYTTGYLDALVDLVYFANRQTKSQTLIPEDRELIKTSIRAN